MQKETVTIDKLSEAVGYLTEQVIELKGMYRQMKRLRMQGNKTKETAKGRENLTLKIKRVRRSKN